MADKILHPDAVVTAAGIPLRFESGDVGLDFNAIPYGSAQLTVPLEDAQLLDQLDPRLDDPRVVITAGGRVFDMSLRSRRGVHSARARTVSVTAETDEAILRAYRSLVDDLTPFGLAGSLRAVVNYVLGIVLPGTVLEPGTDADVTAHWRVINLLRNPAVTSGVITNWSAGGGCTIAYAAEPSTGSVRVVPTGAAGAVFAVDTSKYNINAEPGAMYVFSVAARNEGTQRAGEEFAVTLRFLDNNNETIVSHVGPWQQSTQSYARVEHTAVAPANAVKVAPYWSFRGSADTRAFRVDAGLLVDGDPRFPIVPFTGSDADDEHYRYEYQGAAADSPSVRTPDVERDPKSLVWAAGVSAWEFLEPLCAIAGLRLFCDERRRWHLVDPAGYAQPGVLTVHEGTSSAAADEITVDDADVYATGVVVRYRWEDRNGTRHERVDAAGEPGVVRVVDVGRPYPGPGLAAAILARMTGRGRVQEATTLADWTVTPGMECRLILPGAPTQLGQLRTVRWALGTAFMDVTTGALVDLIPGSWPTYDAATWDTVAPALEWKDA